MHCLKELKKTYKTIPRSSCLKKKSMRYYKNKGFVNHICHPLCINEKTVRNDRGDKEDSESDSETEANRFLNKTKSQKSTNILGEIILNLNTYQSSCNYWFSRSFWLSWRRYFWPTTSNHKRLVVVFTDYLTKLTEAFAIPDQKASTIARVLIDEVIARHSAQRKLLSDQGRNFLAS